MKKSLFITALCFAPLMAIFVGGPTVPMARLFSYTESVIKQNPSDAEAYYLLGRLHSLAFAQRTELGASVRDGEPPKLTDHLPNRVLRESTGKLTDADIDHFNQSIANYKRAIELDPDSALYHFSLGWMQEQISNFAAAIGTDSNVDWIDRALAEYRAAYRLALPHDLKSRFYLEPYLSDEAGSSIIEILQKRPRSEEEIAGIRKNIIELRGHSRAVTPVVFSLKSNATLSDLLSDRQVGFDLDGFASGRRWPWVQPETCILVWDPDRTGQIASGRQLFGSVTWWMFWRNGYEPLAALDDNRDGVLSGEELRGIAVWRDENSNGIADPGEVVPVEDFGIVEIAVKARQVDGVLESVIKMREGKSVKTFDWTPRSIPQDSPAAPSGEMP